MVRTGARLHHRCSADIQKKRLTARQLAHQDGGLVASAVNDAVWAVRRQQLCDEICSLLDLHAGRREQGEFGAQALCQRQVVLSHIGDDYLCRAKRLRCKPGR